MDGTGRAVLAWDGCGEGPQPLSFAAGPHFAPAPFVDAERRLPARRCAAGPRGDVLAAWAADSYPRAGALRVAVARPGAPFSAPTLLGRSVGSPAAHDARTPTAAAPSPPSAGPSAARAPYVRVLRPDGTWGARINVQHKPAGLAPAGPGSSRSPPAQRDRNGDYRVLRLRVLQTQDG